MNKNQQKMPEYFNIREASQYIGVSKDVMTNWLADRKIPFFELPSSGFKRFVRIRKDDLDNFLARHRKGA